MIQWWCTALQRPWSWKWLPYPGVWLASLIPMGWYLWVTSRSSEPTTRTQKVQFIGGMVVFWIASDWPIGTLGAGYLASAHMLQFLLYTLGSVPLLMLGTPQWLAERVMARLRLRRSVAWFSRSLIFAGLIYNAGLVITHSPGGRFLADQPARFFRDGRGLDGSGRRLVAAHLVAGEGVQG